MPETPRVNDPKRAMDYPRHLDDSIWVVWHSNGYKWPDARRQLSYLSHSHVHIMRGNALWTPFHTWAARFHTEADARAWLETQERLRGNPYHGATVSTVAALKSACGYAES